MCDCFASAETRESSVHRKNKKEYIFMAFNSQIHVNTVFTVQSTIFVSLSLETSFDGTKLS